MCVVFSGIMPFTRTVVFQFGRTIVWSSTLSIFSIFLQPVSFAAAGVPGFLKISFVAPNPACLPSSTISICSQKR